MKLSWLKDILTKYNIDPRYYEVKHMKNYKEASHIRLTQKKRIVRRIILEI